MKKKWKCRGRRNRDISNGRKTGKKCKLKKNERIKGEEIKKKDNMYTKKRRKD